MLRVLHRRTAPEPPGAFAARAASIAALLACETGAAGVVVGLPLRNDGSRGAGCDRAAQFAAQVAEALHRLCGDRRPTMAMGPSDPQFGTMAMGPSDPQFGTMAMGPSGPQFGTMAPGSREMMLASGSRTMRPPSVRGPISGAETVPAPRGGLRGLAADGALVRHGRQHERQHEHQHEHQHERQLRHQHEQHLRHQHERQHERQHEQQLRHEHEQHQLSGFDREAPGGAADGQVGAVWLVDERYTTRAARRSVGGFRRIGKGEADAGAAAEILKTAAALLAGEARNAARAANGGGL
jgi:RNase H-fold protein (predicted Holliday junction resolvase)